MKPGMEQLQTLIDALLAQPEGASYRSVQEPYGQFLQAISPTAAELAAQRAQPPAPAPRFTLRLLGTWAQSAWARTLASLAAQSYPYFDITLRQDAPQGGYILHLWPGDVLSPDALYRFAKAAAGGADLIYCDEDIQGQDEAQDRVEPFFKSAANRLTQLSFDMLSCGVAVRRELYRQTGPVAGAAAEDRYAYNLRCLSACSRAQHIPRPLYTLAQDRRPCMPGRLEPPLAKGEMAAAGQWPGSLRVECQLKKQPSVAIIIPNLDGLPALRRLLESIEAQTLHPYSRILIADLGSKDAQTRRYYGLLEKHRAARILYGPQPLSKLLNRAALEAGAEVLIFLGRDTEILAPNWLESLLGQLYRPGVGAVGGKLVDGLGRLRFCGGAAGPDGLVHRLYEGSADTLTGLRQNRFANSIRAVSFLSLSCMALRASIFWQAGGFHEGLERFGLDTALCLRLRQLGLSLAYTPYALLRCHAAPPSPAEAPAWDARRCGEAVLAAFPQGDPHLSPHYDASEGPPVYRA